MQRHFLPTADALLRLWMSVVVSVSILQTPIPIAHAHSEFESHQQLASHLGRHHCQDAVPCDDIHWHLTLPGESHDDHESGQERASTPVALLAVSATTAAAAMSDFEIDRLREPMLGRFTTLFGSPRCSQVSSSPPCPPSSSMRVCALLCAMRC